MFFPWRCIHGWKLDKNERSFTKSFIIQNRRWVPSNANFCTALLCSPWILYYIFRSLCWVWQNGRVIDSEASEKNGNHFRLNGSNEIMAEYTQTYPFYTFPFLSQVWNKVVSLLLVSLHLKMWLKPNTLIKSSHQVLSMDLLCTSRERERDAKRNASFFWNRIYQYVCFVNDTLCHWTFELGILSNTLFSAGISLVLLFHWILFWSN